MRVRQLFYPIIRRYVNSRKFTFMQGLGWYGGWWQGQIEGGGSFNQLCKCRYCYAIRI